MSTTYVVPGKYGITLTDRPECEGHRGCHRRPTRYVAGRRVCGRCAKRAHRG